MIRTARLVLAKDLRIEWRSRVLAWQVLPFAAIALVLCALAVGPDAATLRRDAPGLFYLVMLLTSLLMIGRAQSIEAPNGTRSSIQMLGLDAAGVFLGKAAALFVELLGTGVLLLAGVVLVLHTPLARTAEAAPGVALALGAVAAGGTIYGALVGDARANVTLLPVVALPPFAGLLIVAEKAFTSALDGGALTRWLVFLAIALAAYSAVGVLLYGVAEDSA